ncbi:MAG: hypothetical protein ACKVQW_04185 [Pyrinomonadaceae bacterium]
MKRLEITILALFLLVFVTGTADAQKKTTRKTIAKKTTTRVVPPLAVRTARERVQIQQDNVIFWINKLGPIASALELLDQSYATKKPSAATLSTHESRKQNFVQILRNLRDDLAVLESEFRTKTELKKYLINIQGITDLAAESEDSAIAGKFVAAKEPLREVSKKLTDTLAAMPR